MKESTRNGVARFHDVLCALVVLGCLAILALSAFPGVLPSYLPFVTATAFVGLLVLGFCSTTLVVVHFVRRKGLAFPDWMYVLHRPRLRHVGVFAGAVLVTLVALATHLPARVGFAMSRDALEALITSDEANDPNVDVRVDVRAGIYDVERILTDAEGGVYFVTRSEPYAFPSPTVGYYGFAWRPRPSGSPLGLFEQRYATWSVGGGWHGFFVAWAD